MITRVGTFRTGGFKDTGVSLTRNEFPQFTALLAADEVFDTELQQWVQLDTGEEMVGYFVLVDGAGKKTLNCTQIQKVTNWNGTIDQLAAMDLSQTPVQFRVEEHLYDSKTTLQITWIDEYDAVPGAKVKKLEGDELKSVSDRYKGLFTPSAMPAKAPAAAPAATPATTVPAKRKPGRPPKATTTAAPAQTPPPAAPASAPAGKPTPPRKPAPTAPKAAPAGCTKEEAWDTVYTAKGSLGDDEIALKWTEACANVAPGKEDEQITAAEWLSIRDTILSGINQPQ